MIYYPTAVFEQFEIIKYRPVEAALFFSVVLLMNFGVDYLSNILTISLLRMAMLSGRVFDTIIVFVADVTLTITIFTLVFPVGVTLAAVVSQGQSEKGVLVVLPSQKWTQMAAEERHKKKLTEVSQIFQRPWEAQTLAFAFSMKGDFGYTFYPDDNPSGVTTLVPAGTLQADTIRFYKAAMLRLGIFSVITDSTNTTDTELEVSLQAQPFSWPMIWDMYYSTYKLANIMRDSLFRLIRLEPVQISFSSIYSDYQSSRQRIDGKEFVVALCQENRVRRVDLEKINSELDACKPAMILVDFSPFDYWWGMKRSLSVSDVIPMTPFFFTSFATSILYYALIFISLVGLALLRVIRRLYISPYLDTPHLPFSVLGSAIAIVLIISQWVVIQLI